MTLSPINPGLSTGLAMSSIIPTEGTSSTSMVSFEPGLMAPQTVYQVTVLDAASGESPRTLAAKVEFDNLPPGPARDASGIEVNFSIKIGEEWRNLGNATSDGFAFARLPFPRNQTLAPGHYEIRVQGAKPGDRVRPSSGRLLVTGRKPALLVSVDGPVLKSPPGISAFLGRNLFHLNYPLVDGAHEALHRLAEHYDLVYVAPLRDESTLENTRKNLFELGGLPPGPILTNDFGWRFKEHSRTVSYQRLREYMDNAIAGLRGFEGVPLIGGIGRSERGRIDRTVMQRHCLETQIVPDTTSRWWQFWKRFPRRDHRRLLAGKSAWHRIADHYLQERERLTQIAHGLYDRRFHADPHIRHQTELDLVSSSQLCLGNSAKVYVNGPEAFDAVTTLMRGAETLFGEIYEWGPDEIGQKFADILSERAAAGKTARMTADFFGSSGWSLSSIFFFLGMTKSGVHISRFVFPLAEVPALIDAPFFRTHRKVLALKILGENGAVRDVAVLGGRNWKKPYWTTLHDYTIVVEGNVVKPVVEHLTHVADKLTGAPLTRKERQAFHTPSPNPHPDNQPLRYVVHYPKNDASIQRTFLSVLRNPESREFIWESPFPIMTDLMREIIAEKRAHPEKEFTWILGTQGEKDLGLLDANAVVQGLILKRHGIRVVMRGPLNENHMSPMHAKSFSDGHNLAVCSWNTDEQANKDLETCVLMSRDTKNPKTQERINQALDDGLRKDLANGIDIEEWLNNVVPANKGRWANFRRRVLLKLAQWTQRSLNYFL